MKPLMNITDFRLVDTVRKSKERKPSDFSTLLNFDPSMSDGLRIRRGYADYAHPFQAYAIQDLINCPIQNPSQEDVLLGYANGFGAPFMSPWWQSTVKQTTPIPINEQFTQSKFFANLFDFPNVSFPTANTMKVLGWTTLYSTVTAANYFKGWKIYDVTKSTSTIITASLWDSGTDSTTFTFVDDVAGVSFASADQYQFYRGFHDNHTFAPQWNYDTNNPPCAISDSSLIYASGGQGSDNGNRGVIIYPRMNKTFFPAVAGRSFTMDGTYACEEECKAYNVVNTFGLGNMATGVSALDHGYTYWVGVAAIYDDGTIGVLQKYETYTNYLSLENWTHNYVSAVTTWTLVPTVAIKCGSLNKTVQGFSIYLAKDFGNTQVSGRQTAYFNVGSISLVSASQNVDTTITGGVWVYGGGNFALQFEITGDMWTARGNTYETDSGLAETQTDVAYAYSGRVIADGRHWLYNVYVQSQGIADKQNVFTNPQGQNANINSGIIARRVFPNEDGYYRLRVLPFLGSKINGLIPMGTGDVICLKDRGTLSFRPISTQSGSDVSTQSITPDVLCRKIDDYIGASSFKGFSVSDMGGIFFAGYDDCYYFENGKITPLIENKDQEDWLYVYRELINNAAKETTSVIWLPQNRILFSFGITNTNQFELYPDGWVQTAYHQSSGLGGDEYFRTHTRLRNGSVVAVSNVGARQFQNPATGTFYYTDGGLAIKCKLDTGYFNFDSSNDFVLDKFVFNRTVDVPTTGQLDIQIFVDGTQLGTYSDLDKTSNRIRCNCRVEEIRRGFLWRYVYNTSSTPEIMGVGGIAYQVNSIEIYGGLRTRSKKATEVAFIGNVGFFDIDVFDAGKVVG